MFILLHVLGQGINVNRTVWWRRAMHFLEDQETDRVMGSGKDNISTQGLTPKD